MINQVNISVIQICVINSKQCLDTSKTFTVLLNPRIEKLLLTGANMEKIKGFLHSCCRHTCIKKLEHRRLCAHLVQDTEQARADWLPGHKAILCQSQWWGKEKMMCIFTVFYKAISNTSNSNAAHSHPLLHGRVFHALMYKVTFL